jgi:hypothetical protein
MKPDGIWLKDDQGRTLLLRGANLGGSTKVPVTPDGATYRQDGFFNGRDVSFVGRPFPLDEADEHFTRLRAWGMTFLRFLITWEAIEHDGPGQYDEAYLDYVRAVVEKAGEYGINVFIDPHQDVWSRWTGGDGAPSWTLEAIGMDITKLHTTGAAITHQTTGDPFPRMIWPSNYARLGAATMFTLFFGGKDFAPNTFIDGVQVQEYLQSHYLNAVKQVAYRLRDLPNVVGYDSLNEPSAGYIGVADANVIQSEFLLLGPSPSPFQAMLLAAGYPQEIAVYELGFEGMQQTGTQIVNPDGVRLWKPGYECVFKQNGVWTDDGGTPRLLRPHHFARKPDGGEINPMLDYQKPFMIRFINEIRAVDPRAMLFLEGSPTAHHVPWGEGDPVNAVNAAHWYDVTMLLLKMFNPDFTIDLNTRQPVTGADNVQAVFTQQLAANKSTTIPTVIGEFGLAFDLDDKRGYHSGDFTDHTRALDMYYNAMDANLLNCTIWNYTADNTNERGDLWNDEDLSIFSRDQQDRDWREDIHAGGRSISAIVRPFARATAGEPLRMHFDLTTRRFEFEYRHDPAVTATTEIFVPSLHYPNGIDVQLSDGTYTYDAESQILRYQHTPEHITHAVVITPTAG